MKSSQDLYSSRKLRNAFTESVECAIAGITPPALMTIIALGTDLTSDIPDWEFSTGIGISALGIGLIASIMGAGIGCFKSENDNQQQSRLRRLFSHAALKHGTVSAAAMGLCILGAKLAMGDVAELTKNSSLIATGFFMLFSGVIGGTTGSTIARSACKKMREKEQSQKDAEIAARFD